MPTIDTRELIIDVARRLFAQQGIESTTIGDVAAASNKSRRTIYTYFKSKEELLEASENFKRTLSGKDSKEDVM